MTGCTVPGFGLLAVTAWTVWLVVTATAGAYLLTRDGDR